jgi:hypothetical protein
MAASCFGGALVIATPNAARPRLLRLALRLDAVASGALALLALAAAPLLDALLGVPAALLYPVGAGLLVWAAGLGLAAARPAVSRPVVRGVIALNVLWVAASAAAVLAGWLPLTALGTAFVAVQAIAVAAFADLQLVGLRRV